MRPSKFTHWALFTALCFVPMPAFADFACPVAQIFECTPVAGCQPVTAEQANLPPAVTLNVREKRLFSGVFGGEGLFEPGDAYEDPNVLILHGRHGLLTWTAVVDKATVRCLCRSPSWVKPTRSSEAARPNRRSVQTMKLCVAERKGGCEITGRIGRVISSNFVILVKQAVIEKDQYDENPSKIIAVDARAIRCRHSGYSRQHPLRRRSPTSFSSWVMTSAGCRLASTTVA